MQLIRLFALAVAAAALTGCAGFTASPYSADYGALDELKARKPGKVQVAQVKPTDPAAPVNRLSLRGAPFAAPGGTFTQYLHNALVADLKEIDAFDIASDTRIDATVLSNDIDVRGIATGQGAMEVEIVVTRASAQRLRKVYQAKTQFESSLAANIAIPRAQLEYSNLVRTLLKQVYSDPDFVSAIKKS